MPIWVFMVRYDGEMACSTHFTEKGAILAAIEDIMQYLGIEDEEDAKKIYNDRSGIEEDAGVEPPEWHHEKLRKMTARELYGIFGEWVEKTWDDFMYECEITKTRVAA